VQVRDRYCVGPTCVRPARACDLDHTIDHAFGGLSKADNLGTACKHDHRMKHRGGWTLTQPSEGVFSWHSRTGTRYDIARRPIIPVLPEPRPSDVRGDAWLASSRRVMVPCAGEVIVIDPLAAWDNDPYPSPPSTAPGPRPARTDRGVLREPGTTLLTAPFSAPSPPLRSSGHVLSTSMIAKDVPRYRFERDARYLVIVRGNAGGPQQYRLEGYQGWLAGPDGVSHRFGRHRRTRTELRDDRITSIVGPLT